MPLSDHEQRLLEQIEQNLYAEDPKFASTVRATDLRTHTRRRRVRGAVLFGLGFVLLAAGIFTQPVLSMIGFVVMIGAALYGLSSPSRGGRGRGRSASSGPAPSGGGGPSGGVVDRMEDRWKKRWEQERGSE